MLLDCFNYIFTYNLALLPKCVHKISDFQQKGGSQIKSELISQWEIGIDERAK